MDTRQLILGAQPARVAGEKVKDLTHIVRWRNKLGMDFCEILTGHDRGERELWAGVVQKFAENGWLTYWEQRAAVEDLAAGLWEQEAWPDFVKLGTYDKKVDHRVREFVLNKFYAWNGKIRQELGADGYAERERTFKENRLGHYQRQLAKQALIDGECPVCLEDVSKGDRCGHGYGNPKRRPDGGFDVDG